MMPAVLLLKEFPHAYHHNYFYFFNGGLLCGTIGFAVGIASFLLYRQVTERKLSPWLSAPLLAALVLLFFADKSTATNLLFMYALSFVLMIVLALCPASHGWFAVVLAFSGSISNSVYLLHVPVYLLAQRMLGEPHVPGSAAMWSLPLLMIAAPISAYFFEKPVQNRLVRSFQRNWPTRLDSLK